jgi:diguanylate cyclase (GGDEF)-like protein
MPATPYDEAKRVAEWLREAIASQQIDVADNLAVSCTVSIGVASLPAKGGRASETSWNFDHLFVSADRALYQAKAAGRNSVRGAEG